MNEFELIRTYFGRQPVVRPDVVVGIGDDAAILNPPVDRQMAMTTDVVVEGVHFLPDDDPVAVGHKALARNLSDLAAMGAEPVWFLLSLTLPRVDTGWLEKFCEGVYGLARQYNMQLIGGDTSRGPLSICIQACGFVPVGQALLRSGAKAGDCVCVTGELGDAGLVLQHELGRRRLPDMDLAAIMGRLHRPMPRIHEGVALRGIATSAIDISDGLLADLGHILEASLVGARIELGRIPLSSVYKAHLREVGWDMALSSGDDYELCFTVPPDRIDALERACANSSCRVSRIGEITAGTGLQVFDRDGKLYVPKSAGHDHFATAVSV